MQKIIISIGVLLAITACGRFDIKQTVDNPNDVHGLIVKAEAGDNDVSCLQLRQGINNAKKLAAKKNASVPELSLPGRYQNALKRYSC